MAPAGNGYDIRRPGLGGLDLIEEARRLEPSMGILVLSAVDEVDTAVSAMKRGARDYVVKPFDSRDMIALVEETLAGSRPAAPRGATARGGH